MQNSNNSASMNNSNDLYNSTSTTYNNNTSQEQNLSNSASSQELNSSSETKGNKPLSPALAAFVQLNKEIRICNQCKESIEKGELPWPDGSNKQPKKLKKQPSVSDAQKVPETDQENSTDQRLKSQSKTKKEKKTKKFMKYGGGGAVSGLVAGAVAGGIGGGVIGGPIGLAAGVIGGAVVGAGTGAAGGAFVGGRNTRPKKCRLCRAKLKKTAIGQQPYQCRGCWTWACDTCLPYRVDLQDHVISPVVFNDPLVPENELQVAYPVQTRPAIEANSAYASNNNMPALGVQQENPRTTTGSSELLSALARGDVQAAFTALNSNPNAIHDVNEIGYGPLHMASQLYGNNTTLIKQIIDCKADPNAMSSANWITPLLLAAESGNVDACQVLLENKADVNTANPQHGGTPLYCAAQNGHLSVVQLLLNNGANPIPRISDGSHPLYTAAMFGHVGVVEEFLNRNVNVDEPGCKKSSALMVASQFGQLETVKLLLRRGANIEAVSEDGAFSLFLAAAAGREEIVQELISSGANVNAVFEGATSADIANASGHAHIAEFIVSKGGQQFMS